MNENLTYTVDNHFDCPFCGEGYNTMSWDGTEVLHCVCDGEGGCGKEFTVAVLDLETEDFDSIAAAEPTENAWNAINTLEEAGYVIEVWGTDPLDVKIGLI
jgi:hypothetical protein